MTKSDVLDVVVERIEGKIRAQGGQGVASRQVEATVQVFVDLIIAMGAEMQGQEDRITALEARLNAAAN